MPHEVIVAGAGFAGAATALALTRQGVRDVLVLEREPAPGAHASGKNAGLVRRLLDDPALVEAAVEGAAFLGARGLVHATGSFVLAADPLAEALVRAAGARPVAWPEVGEAASEVRGTAAPGAAYHTPGDGISHPSAALDALLEAARAAGARVVSGCEARGLRLSGGRVVGVETSQGKLDARAVVDAAGPWAGALARSVGAEPPPLAPRRRHLFVTAPAPRAPSGPWVWDTAAGVYFRGHTGGAYLVSACDEEPHPARPPEVDPAEEARLRSKLAARAPALAGLAIERAWACLRTFAPDGRFVVGPDPAIPGLFYAAGLGGHGLTLAAAVGRLAAEAVLRPDAAPEHFRAARFRVYSPLRFFAGSEVGGETHLARVRVLFPSAARAAGAR